MSNTHCHCPHCGFKVDFPENLAYTSAFCPSCGKQIQLQAAKSAVVEVSAATPVPVTPTSAASAPVTSTPTASVAESSSKPDSKRGKGNKSKASGKSKNRGGLKACPDCNEPISAKYLMCPHCGHVRGEIDKRLGRIEDMLAQIEDNTGTVRWAVTVLAVFLIVATLRACIH